MFRPLAILPHTRIRMYFCPLFLPALPLQRHECPLRRTFAHRLRTHTLARIFLIRFRAPSSFRAIRSRVESERKLNIPRLSQLRIR
jgi:hypothetical protein